jgi:hypothetical protein
MCRVIPWSRRASALLDLCRALILVRAVLEDPMLQEEPEG